MWTDHGSALNWVIAFVATWSTARGGGTAGASLGKGGMQQDSKSSALREGERDPSAVGREVWVALSDLIEEALEHLAQSTGYALSLAEGGRLAEARSAILAAKESQEEVRRGLRWMRQRRWGEVGDSLSVVSVQIENVRLHSEAITENSSELLRAWGRVVGRLTSSEERDIQARILEVRVIGKAFHPGTVMGRRYPTQTRDDLRPDAVIGLSLDRSRTGISIDRASVGNPYWVAIGPPLATDSIPRAIGRAGRSSVAFALRAR